MQGFPTFVALAVCLTGVAQTPAQVGAGETPVASAESATPLPHASILRPISQRLARDFDRRLENPEKYRDEVLIACAPFPEGDLFPFVYPALGYINLALQDPSQAEHCAKQARKLITLAMESTARRIRPPGGDLKQLASYQGHGTYLGQLNLAVSAYGLIGQDQELQALGGKLSTVLGEALAKAGGLPLESYPGSIWPFDTIPVLVSLKLNDLRSGEPRSDHLIAMHLRWIEKAGTDPKWLLPHCHFDPVSRKAYGPPRGCDLSFRLCLLPHLDREAAASLYETYSRHHWREQSGLAGFAEWPGGAGGVPDIDSGPVVSGIGLAASGLGLGAVIALEDEKRLERLSGQLGAINLVRPLFLSSVSNTSGAAASVGLGPLDKKCHTGFLFGDAMLFYVLTWQPWGRP